MEEKLAILGGTPVIDFKLSKYKSIGIEEEIAAQKVIKTGVLSKYLAASHPNFYGGPKVKEFEEKCKIFFKVKHAITTNSWTSGLTVAMGAIGIEPGDEVIVSPWTMCATATSIIHWNAIPVFADIDSQTFCLNPKDVEKKITERTKAILSVDIFGQSSDIDSLKKIALKNNLKLISDSAQSPASTYKGKYTGTISDIGGYSLNCHKHINTGEGGIIVTNSDVLAERMKMIRNHAESIIGDIKNSNLNNMIGHNYRLGEIECAIGIEQLKKLKNLVRSRQKVAEKLTRGLIGLKGLKIPKISDSCTHSYYVYPLLVDEKLTKIKRSKLVKALSKEGIPGLMDGYVNLHLLPMYQNKIAYGSKGFPWTIARNDISYKKGICPVAEDLNDNSFLGIQMCLHEYKENEIELILKAFKKVWKNLEQIK